MFKIKVCCAHYVYSTDYSRFDNVDGGFVGEYCPSVEEAVNDACELLACVYGKEKVAWALKRGIPAMDYTKGEDPDAEGR